MTWFFDTIMRMEIITRQEAIEQGLGTYFTGEPCVRGHISGRYVKGSQCVACDKEKRQHRRSMIKSSQTNACKRAIIQFIEDNRDHVAKELGKLDEATFRALTKFNNWESQSRKPIQNADFSEKSKWFHTFACKPLGDKIHGYIWGKEEKILIVAVQGRF